MINLKDIPVVFSNSREAVIYALEQGLNPRVCIRTTSLALYKNPPDKVVVELHDENIDPSEVTRLLRTLASVAERFFVYLQDLGVEHSLCVDICRAFYRNQALFYNAMLLNEEDFTEPRVILELSTAYSKRDASYNISWHNLLSENDDVHVITVSSSALEHHPKNGKASPNFLTRLRGHTRGYYEYRAWLLFWRVFPKICSRGIVVISKTNPLVWEAASCLARKGYAIESFDIHSLEKPELEKCSVPNFQSFLKTCFSEELSPFYFDRVLNSLLNIITGEIEKGIARYYEGVVKYKNYLLQRRPRKIKAVLSNMPDPSLYQVCKETSVLLSGFQHGHSREIMSHSQYHLLTKEQTVCDVLMTFNEEAALVSNKNKFSIGRTYAVGVSEKYSKSAGNCRASKLNGDILYVSTNRSTLNSGGLSIASWPDSRKDAFEDRLVREVFASLPCKTTFKPYPSVAVYPDQSMAKQACKQHTNVHYFESWSDLSYLLHHYRLLVTSRATSTVGWCLMSKRPLVFIDFQENLPLKEALKQLFQQSLFYFDGDDPEIFQKLRKFLQQPLSSIERLWKSMEEKRNETIRQYFSTGEKKSGLRAAKIIHKNIREKY